MDDLQKYFYINIREYLEQEGSNEIGEADLLEAISDFTCPRNPDVEIFLKNSAIEFTKKNQSVTYLVLSNEENTELLGYFTIAIKPLTINGDAVSNTVKRKLQRVSKLDEATGTYTSAAFLIAQLGKNYTDGNNTLISGDDLLGLAMEKIKQVQHEVGGRFVYLECEDKQPLKEFYERNNFKLFGRRTLDRDETDINGHYLLQYFAMLF